MAITLLRQTNASWDETLLDETLWYETRLSQSALGGRDTSGLPWVDGASATQGAGQTLEAAFGDVMRVVAIKHFHMQRDAGIHGEGLKPFAHEFGIEAADGVARKIDLEDKERSP
jgi:hypothetical protein